jgi:polyferredoxin
MSDLNFSFDVGNNVTNMLRDVAHQLGIAVEKIYPYFVFQQVVNGVVEIVTFLLSCALLLGGAIFFFKLYSKESKGNSNEDEYYEDKDTRELKMIAFGFFSALLFFIFLFTVVNFQYSHYIGMILNPHYYAIKDMLLTSHQLIHR